VDHSTAGSNISVKHCSDAIGIPRRDLLSCSAVPQPPRETERRLINSDVRSCTHITSLNLSLYFRAGQVSLICCSLF